MSRLSHIDTTFRKSENILRSLSHLSKNRPEIRHIFAFSERCSALFNGAGPGDRLSTISLPERSIAARIISISFSAEYGFCGLNSVFAISSTFTKSTPQEAYSLKRES